MPFYYVAMLPHFIVFLKHFINLFVCLSQINNIIYFRGWLRSGCSISRKIGYDNYSTRG